MLFLPPRLSRSLLALCLLYGSASASDRENEAFFESQVRPLLIKNCCSCHGDKKQRGSLRLTSRAAMLRGGDSGPALVPGSPENSLLIQAVLQRGELKMPPRKKLSTSEIAILKKWVKLDAPWPGASQAAVRTTGSITEQDRKLWSFQPVRNPDIPPVSHSQWCQSPIDHFILARLESRGLTPGGPASRRALIRRVTFDLLGLPPSPKEVDAFVRDRSPNAWPKVVDRLLASPHYGERWGRHWLDVVRYADTAGETADFPVREAHLYRDYVIDSLNKDKSYDTFLREQIAGDLLAKEGPPEQYREQGSATGYLAIARRFGFDPENYMHLTYQDVIDTVGQSVLGLTLGCARCHHHKYDPVTLQDYYALSGIFQSTKFAYPGSESRKRPTDFLPGIPPAQAAMAKKQHEAQLKKLSEKMATIQKEHQKVQNLIKALAASQKRKKAKPGENPFLADVMARRLDQAVPNADGRNGFHVWRTKGGLPSLGTSTAKVTLKVPGTVPPGAIVVHPGPRNGVAIGWRSPFQGKVKVTGRVADAHLCGDSIQWHLDLLSAQQARALAGGAVPQGGSHALGSKSRSLQAITVQKGDLLQLSIHPKKNYGCDLTQVDFAISEVGGKREWDLRKDISSDLLKANPHPDSLGHAQVWHFYEILPDRGLPLLAPTLTPQEQKALPGRMAKLSRDLQALQSRLDALKKKSPYPMIYGVQEGKIQDGKILIRGERDRLGPTVPRRLPELFGSKPIDKKESGRRQLAEWLTATDNPLTPRVIVNRIWHYHFGQGLVTTLNDFGARGQPPSHPQLLDYLATRLMQSGWSLKRLHRLILTSSVYQLSSDRHARAEKIDPGNRLLARFSRRRLEAEAIRDTLLAIGGGLDLSRGEGHPFPPVEKWNYTQHAPFLATYPSNRRSIYLMTQRLRRHPFLALFDGADTNASTPQRATTTVPTQALFFMSSPLVHQQAKAIAQRVIHRFGDEAQRLTYLFRLTLGRVPTTTELEEMAVFIQRYHQGLSRAPVAVKDRELQVWSAVCRSLFARNEFIYLD